MITKKQRANAERIKLLDDTFGHLPIAKLSDGKVVTVREQLNLSIPTAQLIVAGIVTGVTDSNDGVSDDAVAEVEAVCLDAVERVNGEHGEKWGWSLEAERVGLKREVPEGVQPAFSKLGAYHGKAGRSLAHLVPGESWVRVHPSVGDSYVLKFLGWTGEIALPTYGGAVLRVETQSGYTNTLIAGEVNQGWAPKEVVAS